MKANELRIGNFVKSTTMNYECVVYGILNDRLVAVTYPSGVTASEYPEQLAPVQLTEDLLLRAGFENSKRTDKCFEKGTNVIVSTADDKFRFVMGNFVAQLVLREIEYVHQLQNLYFALTGEELTFADNHNPCTSSDPDDRCENCNCWKSTRSNCS